MNDIEFNTFGTWLITTEGDEEGKSITKLGIYTGHVDEIALHLANRCFYSLCFELIDTTPNTNLVPKKPTVSVNFSRSFMDTYSMDKIKTLFKDRPVYVEESNYYRSFKLTYNNPEEIKIKNALSKLTDEEIKLLGLNKK